MFWTHPLIRLKIFHLQKSAANLDKVLKSIFSKYLWLFSHKVKNIAKKRWVPPRKQHKHFRYIINIKQESWSAETFSFTRFTNIKISKRQKKKKEERKKKETHFYSGAFVFIVVFQKLSIKIIIIKKMKENLL